MQPEPALGPRPAPRTFGGGHQPQRQQPQQPPAPTPTVEAVGPTYAQHAQQPYPGQPAYQPPPSVADTAWATRPQEPTRHVDYQEVDADTYHQRAQRQQAAMQPQPVYTAPVEAPRDEPGQHMADLGAEVAVEQARAAGQILGDTDEERPYPPGSVAVPLEGSDGTWGIIHVLPGDMWPSDANSAMHVGDFESWADGCLGLDDYEEIWTRLRPTMGQVGEMFKAWRSVTGQDTGKSLRSPRSLRNAGRR